MVIGRNVWTTYGATALFVLLWSSGAIFSRWGLDHSSVFAILTLRFTLALCVLIVINFLQGSVFPKVTMPRQVIFAGIFLIGGYSICYFLALEYGVTPGVLATVLGVQPILTLVIMERGFSLNRLAGLLLALSGLMLIVLQGVTLTHISMSGMVFALLALASMTMGALLQKRIQQPPQNILPLQYLVSLAICLLFVPFKPFTVEWSIGFILPWLWLGMVISVGAQLLLYRLIRVGNLVNVTSLFYLVPVVTAIMDYLFLGDALSILSLLGMAAILAGLMLVFRLR